MAQERVIADVLNAIPRFTRGTKIAATAASRAPTLSAHRSPDRPDTVRYMRLEEIGEIDQQALAFGNAHKLFPRIAAQAR